MGSTFILSFTESDISLIQDDWLTVIDQGELQQDPLAQMEGDVLAK